MTTPALDAQTSTDADGRWSRLSRRVADRPVLTVFVVALALRVVAAIAIWIVWGGGIFGDELTYSEMAAAVAEGGTGHWDGYTRWLYWTTSTWTLPLTGLYQLVGPHVLAGQLLAALAGAGAAALTARVALEALEPPWALGAGLAVAVLPSQVLWSSLTLKDAAVWLVAAAVGLAVARVGATAGGRRILLLGLLVLGLVAMAFLRTHSFVVLTWAAALGLMATPRTKPIVRYGASTAILLVVPLLLGLGPAGLTFALDQSTTLSYRRFANAQGASTAIGGLGEQHSGTVDGSGGRVADGSGGRAEDGSGESVADGPGGSISNDPRGNAADGSDAGAVGGGDADGGVSEHEVGADPDTPADKESSGSRARTSDAAADQLGGTSLEHLPYGLSAMLVEPVPGITTGGNPRLRLAALENILWYPLLLLAAVGVASVWGHRRVLAYPVLMAGAIILVYSLTEGNFGTAYRHRGEIVWVMALLAAFGARRIARWVKARQGALT